MGRGQRSERASGEGGHGWLPVTWSLLPVSRRTLSSAWPPRPGSAGLDPKSRLLFPDPVPEQGLSVSGAHPRPLLPSPSATELPGEGPWQSLSTMETTASYLLLIRTAPPGPAESGCRNVALGQAAPRGSEVVSGVSWGWSCRGAPALGSRPRPGPSPAAGSRAAPGALGLAAWPWPWCRGGSWPGLCVPTRTDESQDESVGGQEGARGEPWGAQAVGACPLPWGCWWSLPAAPALSGSSSGRPSALQPLFEAEPRRAGSTNSRGADKGRGPPRQAPRRG